MSEERKSQRVSYAENREKYFDTVVSLFSQGMSAKEIASIVPIGKSTVHRWVDEYNNRHKTDATDLFNVRKSPQTAVRMLTGMKQRIAELEAQIESYNNHVESENREAVRFVRLAKAPTISLVIRKTCPNKDGSFPVKISVCVKGVNAYIATGYTVRNASEWDNGKVVGRDDAETLNKKLERILSLYKDLAYSLPNVIDAKEAKRLLEEKAEAALSLYDVREELETARLELLDELRAFAKVIKRLNTQIENSIQRLGK